MSVDNPLLATGIEHHQAGRLVQAYAVYRQVLASDSSATVLRLIGAVCLNLGRIDEAAGHLSAAIRLDPSHPAAHDNLGILLTIKGQLAEAVESFRRAIERNPRHAQTYLNLGEALARLGRRDEAIAAYCTAAQLAPSSLPAQVEAARALREAGHPVDALPYLRQVTLLKSNDPDARFDLATALVAAGRTDEAIATFQETLQLQPDSAEACVNLAQLQVARSAYDESAAWARRAIHMRPDLAEAHFSLGCALAKLGKLDEAEASLREAIGLKPSLGPAYNNLGIVLLRQGDPTAALPQFDQALALWPNITEARYNRALALLLLGRLEEGLAEYEWRFQSRDFPPFHPRWNLWDGNLQTEAAGKTIVLVAEQGLGDTLQFIRYAAPLAALGARVIVECPGAIRPLLARTPGVSQWIAPHDTPPEADGCIPLLSMPYRLGTTLDTIPRDVPYIFVDDAPRRAWAEKLAAFDSFNVGIAWQGNPDFARDAQRSIPLECFVALAKVPGVRLFNLQKGPAASQLPDFAESWGVIELAGFAAADFTDTAAIMRELDLVITSDTVHAHLAGGLGVPVWVALSHAPDWRWLLARDDCPWYPTMRLFRQQRAGDWSAVFARLADELARLVQ